MPVHRIFLWGEKREGASAPCVGCGNSNPEKWGPLMWQELHVRSVMPRNDLPHWRENETRWLSFNYTPRIPCQECREHLVHHLSQHPLPHDWEEYRDWTIEYHNVVNAKLGKPRWREKSLQPL